MKLSYLFVLTAVIGVIFGLGFLLIPEQVLSYYGLTDLSEQELPLARYFGAALLGYAVLTWLVKDAGPSSVRGHIVLALFVSHLLGLVVALWAQFSSAAVPLGWLNVVIYLVLALGYGYFQFMAPEEQETS